MVSGEIDFIEPDNKGVFHKEKFVIEDKEVEDIQKVIFDTADKIINLKFANDRCEDKECEFCRLREFA